MDLLDAVAPAKVNLFLHIGSLAADGYHPLSSLMAFADFGDRLSVRPAEAMGFSCVGPFADALGDGRNLVEQAAAALIARARRPLPPVMLTLEKRLPVAAGLGGGSSDAAAALNLLNAAWALDLGEEALVEVAAGLGADVAACVAARRVVARGRGERLSSAPGGPGFDAVLVNPRVAVSTAAVFAAFDAAGLGGEADLPPLPDAFESVEEAAAVLAACRNDLEAPAIGVEPVIGDVLATLRDEPEALMARMSGSGATCFALCSGDIEAEGLAERIEALRPDWWVKRVRLG